ncbi:MAG: hypothetical protein Q9170_002728 [Blastenia crenularia]
MGRSQSPAEEKQQAVKSDGRPGIESSSHRTSVARSMVYLGNFVGEDRGQGAGDTRETGGTYEMKSINQVPSQKPFASATAKPGRPGLSVRIPLSNSKPPVEKSHISPDSALENRQALDAASSRIQPAQDIGRKPSLEKSNPKKPVEKSPFSASSSAASEKPSAHASVFETPAYERWRRTRKDAAAFQTPRKGATLRDELDRFSIASRDEDLSAFDEKPSAKPSMISAVIQSSELKSSVHDFAHEEHRDFSTRLTPTSMKLARGIVQRTEVGSEGAKHEDKVDGGRRLC